MHDGFWLKKKKNNLAEWGVSGRCLHAVSIFMGCFYQSAPSLTFLVDLSGFQVIKFNNKHYNTAFVCF